MFIVEPDDGLSAVVARKDGKQVGRVQPGPSGFKEFLAGDRVNLTQDFVFRQDALPDTELVL